MNERSHRNCLVCGDILVGRKDKKYCDDYCRSSHHQRENNKENKLIRIMNNRLKKNRKILAEIIAMGKKCCSSQQLLFMGFDFSIHTSIYINEIGETCYYCYDRGYVSKGNDQYVIVKRNLEEWEW